MAQLFFCDAGVLKAVSNVNKLIAPALVGKVSIVSLAHRVCECSFQLQQK